MRAPRGDAHEVGLTSLSALAGETRRGRLTDEPHGDFSRAFFGSSRRTSFSNSAAAFVGERTAFQRIFSPWSESEREPASFPRAARALTIGALAIRGEDDGRGVVGTGLDLVRVRVLLRHDRRGQAGTLRGPR